MTASILWLHETGARDRQLAGAKAANLALAERLGLPVYPGFVLTTLATSELADRDQILRRGRMSPLGRAWAELSHDGALALAVRSSSVVEDSTTSSMAGRFVSVLHVRGWGEFVDAVFAVVGSAAGTELGDAPMAVLVQPMAAARLGGVLFGLDPLTGDTSTMRVSVSAGLPDQIVSGAVNGTQLLLGRRGRLRRSDGPLPPGLDRRHLRRLATIARRLGDAFGGPQDIEWLLDAGGSIRLLQTRPVTAAALPPEGSHLLGPGPVAETFPDALSPLERDLWIGPLDDGIHEAVRTVGTVDRRTLGEPFVVAVGGRIAVDLDVLGLVPRPRGFLRRIDPRPGARRLVAAWRLGRLRAAFPAIAHDLVGEVDEHLLDVPDPAHLDDVQLLTVLTNAQRTLTALHAHEVLAGLFLPDGATATSGAALALAEVARARADGLDDATIVARHPAALALVPPRIGGRHPLPPVPDVPRLPTGEGDDPTAAAREALRMRVRWVHELTAVVVDEVARRLVGRGQLESVEVVRDLPLATVRTLSLDPARTAAVPAQPADAPPLPARFRLAADGSVVPDLAAANGDTIGVSAGRAEAPVTRDPNASRGRILVTRALAPELAGALAEAAGVVAETGSPLSHLAILAREYGVPVVVGAAPDVLDRVADGDVVRIDGATGEVDLVAAARRSGPDDHDHDHDHRVGAAA